MQRSRAGNRPAMGDDGDRSDIGQRGQRLLDPLCKFGCGFSASGPEPIRRIDHSIHGIACFAVDGVPVASFPRSEVAFAPERLGNCGNPQLARQRQGNCPGADKIAVNNRGRLQGGNLTDQPPDHRLPCAGQARITLAITALLPGQSDWRVSHKDQAAGHCATTQSNRMSWPA